MKTTRPHLVLLLIAFGFVMVQSAAAQRVRPGGVVAPTPPPPVVIIPVSKG